MVGDRIHIAYFTADWNRELVSVALDAVVRYLDRHENVYVQVFDCFSFDLYSGKDGSGYEIYNLPDLSLYDAVLVQAHEIMDTEVLRGLEKRIISQGIPAISIGAKMNGCFEIGTDDYSAEREITSHLVKVHGARTFLFLKGCEREDGTGEAELRRRAFEDVCRENRIPPENITYYEGNWESRRGRWAAKELLDSGKPLPDAIVSANDEMALGALSYLTEKGVRVPQDVMVTGFDGILSASLSDPRLTTISRDFGTLIYQALELLCRSLNRKEIPKHSYSPYRVICSESCGCYENYYSELPRIKKMYYQNARLQERIFYQQDLMTADLFQTDSSHIIETVERHYQIFGEGNMYIYANDRYFDQYAGREKPGEDVDSGTLSDTFVLTCCGGHALARGKGAEYMRIGRKDLTVAPLLREERFAIFYALHFRQIHMGFLVLTQPPSVAEMQLHENIVNLCVFAIENARQRIRSRNLNRKLNALYVRDQLTGFYNRFGYDRLSEDLFDSITAQGGLIQVLFLDIDDMKGINDKYGHEKGDLAIKTVSRVVDSSCRKSDFKMRYGGDEFVIITQAGKADLKGRLEENIRHVNESGELPFYLGVSIGEYTVPGNHPKSLDDLLRHADELMYRDKSHKKQERIRYSAS